MHTMRIRFVLIAALAFAPWVAATGRASEPLTLTTPEQENQMGEEAYKETLAKEKRCADPAVTAFVEGVARRVAAAAPDKGFKYEIAVLESDTANAFCLPGGKICVYTGILPYCQNEAGLGTVLGHEIGHAIARHGGQRMTQAAMVDIVGGGLAKLLEGRKVSDTTRKVTLGAYSATAQLGLLLPYSRQNEYEADDLGLGYMAQAGYDPQEAVNFWTRFAALGSATPTFLSTHPASLDREQKLAAALPAARKLYAQAPQYGCGSLVPASCRYLGTAAKPATATASTPTPAPPTPTVSAPSASTPAPPAKKSTSGWWQKVKDVVAGASSSEAAGSAPAILSALSATEVIQGLRQALSNGVGSAISQLGRKDGFFLNPSVKIPLPEGLAPVEKALRTLGKGKYADDFIERMNRAAEQAVPQVTTIFGQALTQMTFDDAMGILKGPPDAATQFFKRTSQTRLEEMIKPLVAKVTSEVGVTATYKKMVGKAGPAMALLGGNDLDLDAYVTTKSTDGLFYMIAQEEARIRKDPVARTTEILRKVFGAK